MKVGKLDFSVAILAGVSCFGSLIGLPIWALFIGWAWYFALVASGTVFKQAVPPMIAGSLLAVVAIIMIALLGGIMPALWAMVIGVTITVFLLMLTTKIPVLSYSLVSFNAYSYMFAGFYAGNFPEMDSSILNYGSAILWITGANFIGLLFGLMSIKFASIGKTKE